MYGQLIWRQALYYFFPLQLNIEIPQHHNHQVVGDYREGAGKQHRPAKIQPF
jgi:hypothetical protein